MDDFNDQKTSMNKKNEKRLCWNCHGEVSFRLEQCPYCGVDFVDEEHHIVASKKKFDVTAEEWNEALAVESKPEPFFSRQIVALLTLFSGSLLTLFSVLVFYFAREGAVIVTWTQRLSLIHI